MVRAKPLVTCTLWLGLLGCTEPNPYAQQLDGTGGDTSGDPSGETTATGDGDGDPTGEPEPDPSQTMAFELVDFQLQGEDSFVAEIPKPADRPQTAPLVAIHRYAPGQSDNLGWTATWTESETAWTVEITTANAAPNSRVAGVAAVLGFGAQLPAPVVETRTLTTADGCATLEVTTAADTLLLDMLESYAPGEAAVFEVERTRTADGDATTIEYCVTQPDGLDASVTVKLLAFELPAGAGAAPVELDLTGQNNGTESFAQLGQADAVAHLIGPQQLVEAAAPQLGWQLECATTPPFACDYALTDATGEVTVALAGAALASP